jgi:hypothetical protein
MKRFLNWQMLLASILITLSALFYFIDYLIIKDLHSIFVSLIGNIAFLFVYVLIVTLVLEGLLEYRGKQSILKKLNMVIGSFFCEVGTELLKICSGFDPQFANLRKHLVITKDWSDRDFLTAHKYVQEYKSSINSKQADLNIAKNFLIAKRVFLLSLLENPNLLEHESFTNLLWAVFHLTDELALRADLNKLPEADYQHLSVDIKRAYQQLILQWLDYMKHLKLDYPYLFSLAMRTNPFDANAVVEVSQ